RAHQRVVGPLDSRHSCVVIRAAYPTGYDVSMGSRYEPIGHEGTYEAAERLGIARVRALRDSLPESLRDELHGLPVTVYRGPVLSTELLCVSGGGRRGRPTFSGLAVVAVVRGDHVERFPERITWSDDASRARARERGRPPSAAEALGVSVRTLERLRAEFDAEAPKG